MAESLKARVRRATNRVLHSCGLHLARRESAFEMDDLLAQAAARLGPIRVWVDVGASDGQWSVRAQRHFPSARFVLFEPLAERQAALAALQQRRGYIPIAAAAGAAPGTVAFAVDAGLDGSGIATGEPTPATRSVPVETIDRVVARHQLAGPYGLKLDTHGHELAVLEGAAGLLPQVNLLIVEAYNFQLTPSSPRFHELCAWLEARGFRCCDLADPMRRPHDGALWQMDLAFAPASSPLFASNRYS